MLNDRTKALIREYNPCWEDRAFEVPIYHRHIFPEIEKYLGNKQIIAVVGLRRVGKTVLMKQLIKELLKENKYNVFYFLFDDLLTQNPEVLEDVLNYYLKTVAKDGRKYILLDEIQKVPFWQDILKRFYDNREDIKFIVTGSASLQINKSKESLAGRIFDLYMPILSFREFLEMNGLNIDKVNLEYNILEKKYEENLHRIQVMNNFLSEYILKGAFPEIAKEENLDIIRNYVKNSVIEKIVFEDIPTVFNVRRKEILYSVLEYSCRETSNILDITKLAETLKVNYLTVRDYLFYLQNSFVINLVYNYSKSAAKQLRKNKKIHIIHPSVALTMMRYPKDILGIGEIAGKYVETIVFQHSRMISERLSFWRTPQKEEVDIILDDLMLPIEVKYKSNIDRDDIKNILKFLEKYKKNKGLIVTKDVFRREEINGKEIVMIPAWLFLLVV